MYADGTYHVKNTNSLPESQAIYIMPSPSIESDSLLISNQLNDIISNLPKNATEADKIRSIHNWIIDYLEYDHENTKNKCRQRQTSQYVLLNRTAMCEGYTNLAAAMFRKIGIKSDLADSDILNHTWNRVNYQNQWYLIDATLDDPYDDDSLGENQIAIKFNPDYTNFLTSLTDEIHTDPGRFTTDR